MPFVVIALPRTGSSHFMNVLSGHPDVFTNGNIFDDRQTVYAFWPDMTARVKADLIRLRRDDPQAFLRRIFAASYGRSHVGFKIFQGENDTILSKLLIDSCVKKIVLYRRNVLACYSSALVARATGQYSTREGKEPMEPPTVRFNANRFRTFHDRYISFYRQVIETLTTAGEPHCMIDYEGINDKWLIWTIFTFIGIDPAKQPDIASRTRHQVKQNSSHIAGRFSNKGEVIAFLRENGLMHWAHEGEYSMAPWKDQVEENA